MKNFIGKINPFLFLTVAIYLFLGVYTIDNCYFWDVIQQVSKEGYWFYATDFSSLLIPDENDYGIAATGYHPPLMGVMTALLWKLFGCELWVSHVFSMFWAVLLLYNVWRLMLRFFSASWMGWVVLIMLSEPVILSQFVISSPDFILFTAFVMAVRGMFERKLWLQMIGVFFLCCINMRGVFAGIALFAANYYYDWMSSDERNGINALKRTLKVYLPTMLLLLAYFTYYFIEKGWFFADSAYTEHYVLPDSPRVILQHLFSFGLRLLENGHFIIWLLALCLLFSLCRKRYVLTLEERVLGVFFLLSFGLYFLFVFISQMPFSPRYFMPLFFVLNILVLSFLQKHKGGRCPKFLLMIVLFFLWTGNLWIYPDKIAKPWDSTLGHLPYYELRRECFDYIDEEGLDYKEFSSGFCLYGDRGYSELQNWGMKVSPDLLTGEYVIYSNISNWEDKYIVEVQDSTLWRPLKDFKCWPVEMIIYQRVHDGDETGR